MPKYPNILNKDEKKLRGVFICIYQITSESSEHRIHVNFILKCLSKGIFYFDYVRSL